VIPARYEELCDIAGPVSRETFHRLEGLEQFFLKWASRTNLVAPSTLDDVWRRHILDSAQLFPLAPTARRWLDIGSGGGFPGLVIACLLLERPGSGIDLVEANFRKAGYLRAATGELGLSARVHPRRTKDVHGRLEQPEIVTARAVAPLADLIGMAEPWLAAGATGLFHKGRDYRSEVQESGNSWFLDLVEHPSRIAPDSVVLEVRDVRRLGERVEAPGGTN
jgi:16S rRNA (guanine527-N7)-methyltransferase